MEKDTLVIDAEVGPGDRHNTVFRGTTATYGHRRAVVVATGMQTEIGRIAGMLKEPRRRPRPCSASSPASAVCSPSSSTSSEPNTV